MLDFLNLIIVVQVGVWLLKIVGIAIVGTKSLVLRVSELERIVALKLGWSL